MGLTYIHHAVLSCFSHVQLYGTLWTVACQTPLSMGFPRQEYWSELPFPSQGDLPDPGIKPRSPVLQADSLPTDLQGKPLTLLKPPNFSLCSSNLPPSSLNMFTTITLNSLLSRLSRSTSVISSRVLSSTFCHFAVCFPHKENKDAIIPNFLHYCIALYFVKFFFLVEHLHFWTSLVAVLLWSFVVGLPWWFRG